MRDTKERNRKQYQWQTENKERINLLFLKGTKERLATASEKHNISISEYTRRAIEEALKQDGC